MPGVSFAGYDSPFTWNNLSPRAGILYALDAGGKTAVRVTYSRFAGQLATTTVGVANVASGTGSITYRWTDLDGDGFVSSAAEVNTASQIGNPSGISAANPTAAISLNQIDPGLKAPTTQSVVAGIERELMPNLAAHANYTYSRTSNLFGNEASNITPRVGMTLADYTAGTLLTGTLPDSTAFNVQTYNADPTKFLASGGGIVVKNIPGYYTDYNGIELGLVKRLSNKWMGRATFSYNNAREHFSDPAGKYDTNGNPTPTVTEPLIDGGQFVSATGTATGSYYLNAKWQLNVNGMYEAPYGIQIAANVFGRQGYPFPIFRRTSIGANSSASETLSILVSPKIDTFRYPNVWDTDLRFAREFSHQRVRVRLIADVFNLLNANAPLLRVNDIAATSFNTLQQNMAPRILRFGLVVGF